MFSVITRLEVYNFSSELTDFVITADKPTKVIFTHNENEVILEETFTPDVTGRIVIRELGSLLESYVVGNLIGSFSYTVIQDGLSDARTFMAIYCKAEINTTAWLFMDTYFFTTLIGEKITTLSRKEFLHMMCRAGVEVKAIARYKTGSGVEEVETTLETVEETYKVITLDVSPSRLILEGKELISYRIEAGQRKQTFLVNRDDSQTRPNIVFTNSFGCQETIYCRGTFQLEGEYERSHGYIDGMYRAYHVNEKRTYKANTGILTPAMANWVEDLFRSTELYLMEGETIGKEITITESKFVRSADPDELPSFNFQYRYAQRNQNILPIATAGRIFDTTFDRTFN